MMRILHNVYRSFFLLFLLIGAPSWIYSDDTYSEVTENKMMSQHISRENDSAGIVAEILRRKPNKLVYYLYVDDFINSFIEIPTSNVSQDSTTVSSKYLAGRAPLYNLKDEKVGTCSASFLCMQNADNIFTDIANYISVENGLVITWFTPTTLLNLELDSIVHGMVTECIVIASTKVGFNPFYGKKFNMVVSSDNGRIYFKLKEIR